MFCFTSFLLIARKFINECFQFSFLFLDNDLDSIRALFSEKEKELSLAVAKVDALTRQLEELRRDRRGTINILSSTATGLNQQYNSPSIRELEKLRRELMVCILLKHNIENYL